MKDINRAVDEVKHPNIEIVKINETINIPATQFEDLIRKDERIECVREYIQGTEYIERAMVAKILGFELPTRKENENEQNINLPFHK